MLVIALRTRGLVGVVGVTVVFVLGVVRDDEGWGMRDMTSNGQVASREFEGLIPDLGGPIKRYVTRQLVTCLLESHGLFALNMANNETSTEIVPAEQQLEIHAKQAPRPPKKLRPARKQVKAGDIVKTETVQTGKEYSKHCFTRI